MAILSSPNPVQNNDNSTNSPLQTSDTNFDIEQKNTSTNDTDTSWIQETNPVPRTPVQEQTQTEELEIPNMYIQADAAQNSVNTNTIPTPPQDMTPIEKPLKVTITEANNTNQATVDLDSLFDTPKIVDPIPTIKNEELIVDNKQIDKKSTSNDHKVLQKFVFALGGGVVLIGGAYFIIKTMFPLGLNPDQTDTDINEITFMSGDDTTPTTGEDQAHSAPVPKTDEEIYLEKLVVYEQKGKEYNEIGKTTKNRDLIRYGLFIQKKALDLQDEINGAISNDIPVDKVSVDAYIAQFDEYLEILNASVVTSPTPDTVSVETLPTQTDENNQNTGANKVDLNNFLQQYTIPQQ